MSKRSRGDEAEYVPGTNAPASEEPSLFDETRAYLSAAQAKIDALPLTATLDNGEKIEFGKFTAPVNRENLAAIIANKMRPPWHDQLERQGYAQQYLDTAPHDLTRAYARDSDPDTSARAADRATLRMNENRRAVLDCFLSGARLTDPELIARYYDGVHVERYPEQSASGIRSRRAELVKIDKLKKVGETETHTIWALV